MRYRPRGQSGYSAIAERLYGGGWRITIKSSGYDVEFIRRTDWPQYFPCGEALDELNKHHWDINPDDRYGRLMPTFGWTYTTRVFETWTARLIRLQGQDRFLGWEEHKKSA